MKYIHERLEKDIYYTRMSKPRRRLIWQVKKKLKRIYYEHIASAVGEIFFLNGNKERIEYVKIRLLVPNMPHMDRT